MWWNFDKGIDTCTYNIPVNVIGEFTGQIYLQHKKSQTDNLHHKVERGKNMFVLSSKKMCVKVGFRDLDFLLLFCFKHANCIYLELFFKLFKWNS